VPHHDVGAATEDERPSELPTGPRPPACGPRQGRWWGIRDHCQSTV